MDNRKIGVLIIVLVVVATVSFFKLKTEEEKILVVEYNGKQRKKRFLL